RRGLGALRARPIARPEPERVMGSGAGLEPGKDHRRAAGSLARVASGRGAASATGGSPLRARLALSHQGILGELAALTRRPPTVAAAGSASRWRARRSARRGLAGRLAWLPPARPRGCPAPPRARRLPRPSPGGQLEGRPRNGP